MLHTTLSRNSAIQANSTSNRTLRTLRFNNVNNLVMATYIATSMVSVTLLIIIVLQRAYLRLALRNVRIRTMKIRSVLVRLFRIIPTLNGICLMNMNLLNLLTTATSSMQQRPVIRHVNRTITLNIRLLRATTTPSNVILQINRCLLSLHTIEMRIKIKNISAVPVIAIRGAIIVNQQVMIARTCTTLISSNGMPALYVMITLHLTRVIYRPQNSIMIKRIRRNYRIILTARRAGRYTTSTILYLFVRIVMIIVSISSFARLTVRGIIRNALLRRYT